MVKLDRGVKKPVPPEAIQLARKRVQDVIDDKSSDIYLDVAKQMLAELDK